jgi:hypothetical protein
MALARVYGPILYPIATGREGATVRFGLEDAVRYENTVVPGEIIDVRVDENDEVDISLVPGSYLVTLPDGEEFPGVELTEGMDALLSDLLWPASAESYPSSELFPSENLFPIAA